MALYFPTPPDPNFPLSAVPRFEWQCCPLPGAWTSDNGPPLPMEVESLRDRSPASSDSSLSLALNEDLARPWPNVISVPPKLCDPLPPPSPGWVRIPQPCQVSPVHEIIHFRWKSRVGIPLSSLLAGTRQINHCDNLLSSPAGFPSIMNISWGGYPAARYCIAVKGRLLRFTVQTLGQSVAENIKHYLAANRISLPLNKIVLVAFGRGSRDNDWVAIVDKVL